MKTALGLLGFVFFLTLGMPLGVTAQASGGRTVVAAEEVVDGDYFVAAETVEIAGTVKGDAYVVGGQVFVTGTIDGDLLAVGATISISGVVTQNVRVLGSQVIVTGNVGRNLSVAAMNLQLTNAAKIGGGITVASSNAILAAPIAKDARIAGRNLTVANIIGGDVEAAVEVIRLTSKAKIGGDFTYWSNRTASIDKEALVEGAVLRKTPQKLIELEQIFGSFTSFVKPFLGLASLFASLILGLLLIQTTPEYSRAVVTTLRKRRWRSFTTGVMALLLIPLLFGVLIITIVGIPLGFVLLMLSSVILYVARIFVMLWMGTLIFERLGKQVPDAWAFGVGLILYSLLVLIPLVGWAVSFFAVVFGLGAAIGTFQERYLRKDRT